MKLVYSAGVNRGKTLEMRGNTVGKDPSSEGKYGGERPFKWVEMASNLSIVL